jgi:hypothetical protein
MVELENPSVSEDKIQACGKKTVEQNDRDEINVKSREKYREQQKHDDARTQPQNGLPAHTHSITMWT